MRKIVLAALMMLGSGAASARVRAYYTSRGDDLPAAVREAFRVAEARAAAGRPASVDIAVFSFTHLDIADELTRIVAAQPTVRVRLILDLSQISHSEGHVGPYLEDLKNHDWAAACEIRVPSAQRAACQADLAARYGGASFANLEIKYKWYDAYIWSTSLSRPVLDHSRLASGQATAANFFPNGAQKYHMWGFVAEAPQAGIGVSLAEIASPSKATETHILLSFAKA